MKTTTNIKEDIKNITSYKSIYALRDAFIRSGGRNDLFGDMDGVDMPGHHYFRLFFYFGQGNLLDDSYSTEYSIAKDYRLYNTAKNYLENNMEDERSEKLSKFINLLSNINTFTPWYFAEVGGLDAALTRTQFNPDFTAIEANRRQLQIKCLPDAYDNRIGTLLDLYRDICFSYIQKKEIVPANLRKFDMGIYIFQNPTTFVHSKFTGDSPMKDAVENIGRESREEYAEMETGRQTSYKFIEFHNCEINYNSTASGLNVINQEGINPEYTIVIDYDDAYEKRFNQFILREIGDFVMNDMLYLNSEGTLLDTKEYVQNDSKYNKEIPDRIVDNRNFGDISFYNAYLDKVESKSMKKEGGIGDTLMKTKFGKNLNTKINETQQQINKTVNAYKVDNLINQAKATLVTKLDNLDNSTLNKIYLGNLFTFSYSNTLKGNKQNWLNGDIVNAITPMVRHALSNNRTTTGWSVGKKLPGY